MEPLHREPANVAIILDGAVRVRRASTDLVASLESLGYRPRATRYGTEIPFEPSGSEGDFENESLTSLLRTLSNEEVAFLRDPKQGWSPADVVAAMIEAGAEFNEPRATAFDGSSWWLWTYPWSSQ